MLEYPDNAFNNEINEDYWRRNHTKQNERDDRSWQHVIKHGYIFSAHGSQMFDSPSGRQTTSLPQ